MNRFRDNINQFLELYPEFYIVSVDNEKYILKGHYHLNGSFNDIKLEDFFDLKMILSLDHQHHKVIKIVVFEETRIIDFHHKFTNGSLCLGIPIEISKYLKDNKNDISKFFEAFIIPYLYSYLYYEIYEYMPFGEREHGDIGYLQYYIEVFNVKDTHQLKSMVDYLVKHKEYKGHHECPCGSGKKIRNCHKVILYQFYNHHEDLLIQELRREIEAVKNGKKKNKR
jgi:hypothetical protein